MCIGLGFGVVLLVLFWVDVWFWVWGFVITAWFGIGCCGFLLCLQAVVLVVLLLCAVLFAFAVWFGGVYVCFGC